MNRNILLCAFAAVMLVALSGCESSQSTSSESMAEAAPAGDPNTIKFIAVETDEAYSIAIEGSEEAAHLMEHGELESPITAVGARRNGKKVYGPDEATLGAFLGWNDEGGEPVTTSAFVTAKTEDAIYVAKAGTDAARHLEEHGELASPITAIGARIGGKKVYGADEATLAAFLGW